MNKLSVNQKEFDVVPIYMEDIDFSLKKDQKFELLHFSISENEEEYLDKLIDMVMGCVYKKCYTRFVMVQFLYDKKPSLGEFNYFMFRLDKLKYINLQLIRNIEDEELHLNWGATYTPGTKQAALIVMMTKEINKL